MLNFGGVHGVVGKEGEGGVVVSEVRGKEGGGSKKFRIHPPYSMEEISYFRVQDSGEGGRGQRGERGKMSKSGGGKKGSSNRLSFSNDCVRCDKEMDEGHDINHNLVGHHVSQGLC